MKIPIPKLKAMIRYFATYTDPRLLGKVKLMKLFYFTDFEHVKNFASPITFDNYVHLEHGPVPSTIMNLVSAVAADSDTAILSDTFHIEEKEGSNLKRIVASREFTEKDEQYFSPSELKVLKSVCERFADKNAKFVEDKSHEEAAWARTKELENIPYTLATEDADCKVSKDEIKFVVEAFAN
jgi:uncharacterized phage-associated protein